MFGNKILLINFVKFSKNKVKLKAFDSLSLCNSKSRNFYHQKICDIMSVKCNGFGNRISIFQNLTEIKIRKYLSYISDDKCWNCKQNLLRKQFNCALCGALVQPKKNVNFFELLGISQMYDVDLEDLSKKFKNLQKIFHPDKFANKSPEEQEISESYSRLLNRAYTTLKDPLERGLYMLQLQKIIPPSNFEMEPDFLMFIMERNEELECLDNSNNITKFLEENNNEIRKQILAVSEAFRYSDVSSAKSNLTKLKYFMNLDKKIKDKQTKVTINGNE